MYWLDARLMGVTVAGWAVGVGVGEEADSVFFSMISREGVSAEVDKTELVVGMPNAGVKVAVPMVGDRVRVKVMPELSVGLEVGAKIGSEVLVNTGVV